MLAVLFLCGPIGTAVSFYLLPKESDSADTPGLIRGGAGGAAGGSVGGTRVRMVHLSLAGTDRRARFVLDENTPWDAFVSGARPALCISTSQPAAPMYATHAQEAWPPSAGRSRCLTSHLGP